MEGVQGEDDSYRADLLLAAEPYAVGCEAALGSEGIKHQCLVLEFGPHSFGTGRQVVTEQDFNILFHNFSVFIWHIGSLRRFQVASTF
jgi:hypothetical protein